MFRKNNLLGFVLVFFVLSTSWLSHVHCQFDYKTALTKSLLFFEAQRSGKLPPNQRVQWRGDSGLNDGAGDHVDLTGGYYDAGDNVKFGFSLAFAMTMLSWSVVEYGPQLTANNELQNALDAVKWGTDYILKAHPEPNVFYAEVGDGDSDHACWMRPEDMTTPRTTFKIDINHPGSDLAGETAAALAAASIVLRQADATYADTLVEHARQLFSFARDHPGKYSDSIPIARKFYESQRYQDELLWAAAWLYKATNDRSYLNYIGASTKDTGGVRSMFSWEDKYVGAQILVAKFVLDGVVPNSGVWANFKNQGEGFICLCLQGGDPIKKTLGGLLWFSQFNNLQYTVAASFIATVYSDYLKGRSETLQCGDQTFEPEDLYKMAQSQIDYILGKNPNEMSYMVGFGERYPTHIHHRGASIVSIKEHPELIDCNAGYTDWYQKTTNDPNILNGAVVGGPQVNDVYNDERERYQVAETSLTNVAPIVGILATLASPPDLM